MRYGPAACSIETGDHGGQLLVLHMSKRIACLHARHHDPVPLHIELNAELVDACGIASQLAQKLRKLK